MLGKHPEKADDKRERKDTEGGPYRKSREGGLLTPVPIDGREKEARGCGKRQAGNGVKA